MKGVGAGFGDHVDHSAAGAAQLGRVSVGVDLEFLYSVLAELIRSAARAGASESLAEECVVVVGAINGQGVQGTALTGKAQVPATYIARHRGCEQHKINEVSPVHGQISHSN